MVRRNLLSGRHREPSGAMSEELDNLRRDLSKVRDDVSELVRALMESGRETGEATGESTRQQLRQRLGQLSEAYSSARQRGGEAMHTMTRTARKRPMATASTAFGLGLVVAMLVIVGMMAARR